MRRFTTASLRRDRMEKFYLIKQKYAKIKGELKIVDEEKHGCLRN